MKEDLLVMICCFDEAKVIFEGSDKPADPLRVGVRGAVEDPDAHRALLASSLHFIN